MSWLQSTHLARTVGLLAFFSVTGGSAISCFECHSQDGDMQSCEDEFAPYNVTGHLYRRDCTVGPLGFEAFYCIKIKGVKSNGHTVTIRTCSVTDWGSQCGDIFFEQGDQQETLRGCLASCNFDGCNDAVPLPPPRRCVLATAAATVVINVARRWRGD